MTFDPQVLLGPLGLAAFLLLVVGALWRDHLRADQDDREQRDQAFRLVEGIIPTVRDLAEAQKAANRDAEHRHRKGDEP